MALLRLSPFSWDELSDRERSEYAVNFLSTLAYLTMLTILTCDSGVVGSVDFLWFLFVLWCFPFMIFTLCRGCCSMSERQSETRAAYLQNRSEYVRPVLDENDATLFREDDAEEGDDERFDNSRSFQRVLEHQEETRAAYREDAEEGENFSRNVHRELYDFLRNGGKPGGTTVARDKWKQYEWHGDIAMNEEESATATTMGNYGSMDSTIATTGDDDNQDQSASKMEEGVQLDRGCDCEGPSCSICLCEYEQGEKVTLLHCGHIYHASCINLWTDNRARCPLCNLDLSL